MITDRFDVSVPVHQDRGPLKQMHSGRMVYVLDLQPEDVCPRDIAHHLAIYNRWTGATYEPWSVAQHSLLAAAHVREAGHDDTAELYALLHDAAEAYMGDICRPIKAAFALRAPGVLEEIEAGIDAAIFRRFGLPPIMPTSIAKAVKEADQAVTSTEGRDLVPPALPGEPGADWRLYMPEPLSYRFEARPWKQVEFAFLDRLRHLMGEWF